LENVLSHKKNIRIALKNKRQKEKKRNKKREKKEKQQEEKRKKDMEEIRKEQKKRKKDIVKNKKQGTKEEEDIEEQRLKRKREEEKKEKEQGQSLEAKIAKHFESGAFESYDEKISKKFERGIWDNMILASNVLGKDLHTYLEQDKGIKENADIIKATKRIVDIIKNNSDLADEEIKKLIEQADLL